MISVPVTVAYRYLQVLAEYGVGHLFVKAGTDFAPLAPVAPGGPLVFG